MPDPVLDDGLRRDLSLEVDRLFDGARTAAADGRFWWLDDNCQVDRSHGQQLWITARMTHVFSLGHLRGRPGDGELVDLGLASLERDFGDAVHGGWFPRRDTDDRPEETKTAYEHAFVLLAASSATIAGRPGAEDLLARATDVVVRHFWDDDAGALVESWDRSWQQCEAYRGANANMHSVEAFLAAADATGDRIWLERASRIVDLVIQRGARSHDWRVPEHYTESWQILPDYNRDQPRHPFRPFGVTPGHGFEWSRLLLQLDAQRGDDANREAARGLFDRAMADGWDGSGLVYTTDWSGEPVVRDRFHWVTCEAMATAYALWATTGDASYGDLWRRLWAHATEMFVDTERGGWRHEVDVDGNLGHGTWTGKPDTYHAVQAVLLPLLPFEASFAQTLR
jgi:mannose/cellobiose epimerase-like protein (N-acyl-D-glucosamine 2-epimerase family)